MKLKTCVLFIFLACSLISPIFASENTWIRSQHVFENKTFSLEFPTQPQEAVVQRDEKPTFKLTCEEGDTHYALLTTKFSRLEKDHIVEDSIRHALRDEEMKSTFNSQAGKTIFRGHTKARNQKQLHKMSVFYHDKNGPIIGYFFSCMGSEEEANHFFDSFQIIE